MIKNNNNKFPNQDIFEKTSRQFSTHFPQDFIEMDIEIAEAYDLVDILIYAKTH